MSLALAVALVALLSGCHQSNSPTDPGTGSGVLSGQVVMTGDAAGLSPAGINVSTGGVVATTNASGQFSFVGLNSMPGMVSAMSTGRTLNFTRGDGISASGTVSSSATTVTVQLQKHFADITEGGNGNSNPGGGQVAELEGPITKVSTTSITVANASTHKDETAAITKDTVIRHGNTTIDASKLTVGMLVHVKTTGTADALTATEIIVQN